MMNLRQQFVKGVVWSAIQSWCTQAITFIIFLLLARLIEPEAFGLVSLAGIFLAFVRIFLNQGFASAIIQHQELELEHLNTAFWINIGIGLLLTVIGVAAAVPVADWFNQPELVPIIRWLSLSFLIGAFSQVQGAILYRRFSFKALGIRSLVATAASGVVGVMMALLGYGVWSLVGQQLVKELVAALVLWGVSDWRPGLKVSARHFRELFTFGINIVVVDLLNFVNRRSDDLLIGYFLGSVALGYYTVAYRVLLVMTQLLTSTLSSVAFPVFSRLQKEPEQLRSAFYKTTQLTSLVAFPAFFGMAALASELVRGLFGEQWVPSIPVMQILAFIGILHSVFYFNEPVIMAMGKPSWRTALTCMNAVANFIAFLLVVHWGIVAVAAAYVTRGYLLALPPIWVMKKLINIDIKTYIRHFAEPLIGSIVIVVTVLGAKHFLRGLISLHFLLAICIIISAVVYIVTIRLIAPKLFWKTVDLARLAVLIGTKGKR